MGRDCWRWRSIVTVVPSPFSLSGILSSDSCMLPNMTTCSYCITSSRVIHCKLSFPIQCREIIFAYSLINKRCFCENFLMIVPSLLYRISLLLIGSWLHHATWCYSLLINICPLEEISDCSFSFLFRDLRVMSGFYFFAQLILASSLSGRSETLAVNELGSHCIFSC